MKIKKYDFFEARFNARVKGNPFDVKFTANVFTPNGLRTVEGFYDDNDTYVFRFMPEAEGVYKFQTRCDVEELNDKRGEFECIAASAKNHGKVQVRDQYWFAYADGTPYFEAGTTCYAWIHQGKELREQTLETLSEGYFNKLRMCVFPKWFEYNHRQPELYPFEGDIKSGFDYNRLNIPFFRHLENQVRRLGELGIEADIILFHPYECEDWRFNYMTKEQDVRYLRYVIARLSAYHNVWWSLANEYDLIKTGYKSEISAWQRLIRFVHDSDPYGHLISIHQMSEMYDHTDPNITHCSVQRTEMYLTAEYTDTWRQKHGKPVVIDECVYEGDLNPWWGGITARELIRRFWEATARGGYMGHGETYANENIWWSHGGKLYGESAPRIRFLRRIMEECPDIRFTSTSGMTETACGKAGDNAMLVYFGNYQPHKYELHLPETAKYKVQIIDTWNMTTDEYPKPVSGTAEIPLPGKPYIALLCTAMPL